MARQGWEARVDAAKTVRMGGITLRFLVDETMGRGEMIMFEMVIAPGAKVPVAHYHQAVDEAVYGLGGELTTTIDGTAHVLRTGDHAFIPRGAVHRHENLGSEAARSLIVLTPGSIGRRYFEEMAAELAVPPPDQARLRAIMERHGLIPA